ncbi:MAG: diacylglycerol kinase family lipid kinase [Clostridia bacterium]|nr:diacylglycerol kinase family lipid kinase [Clostridia bacterium]MBR0406958.1 diacylglycerol kinase family lipid kinase [Clostridia bacterium]
MIYVVCNPVAGNGRGRKAGEEIEAMLKEKGIPFRMLWTERPGHASDLAKQASEAGAETVLSIGGDGTAFETAQGLLGSDTALGVIPAGTGNDFVKTLHSPKEPKAALEFILSHPPKKTDAGEINGRMFLNEIGTGFDVSVLDYAEKVKRYCRGLLPYLYGVLQTLFRFRSIPLTYSIDGGEAVTSDAFVVAVANGGIIGGGIPIAPEAKADDGLFDVVIVGKIKKRHLLARLAGLMQGKILSFPETTFVRASAVTFSAPRMRVNIDGEIVGEAEATARILPGVLWVHRA